jgi:hypothetical protein
MNISNERNNSRPKRSVQVLKKYWRHFYYEHQMLNAAKDWLIQNLDIRTPGYEFPIHMESFLIHARNLNQFYYAQTICIEDATRKIRPPKRNDIIAEDYVEGVTAWNPPLENRLPKDLIDRTDKRLAHLTYQRGIGNRNDYDYADILRNLECALEAFLNGAPERRLDQSEFNF